MAEQQFFDVVAKELEQNHLDRGLWVRAFADANGDEAQARALYIRLRAAKLERDAVATQSQGPHKLDPAVVVVIIVIVGVLLLLFILQASSR
jgi:hypothetical protein